MKSMFKSKKSTDTIETPPSAKASVGSSAWRRRVGESARNKLGLSRHETDDVTGDVAAGVTAGLVGGGHGARGRPLCFARVPLGEVVRSRRGSHRRGGGSGAAVDRWWPTQRGEAGVPGGGNEGLDDMKGAGVEVHLVVEWRGFAVPPSKRGDGTLT